MDYRDFFIVHTERFPRDDWPDPDSEFWKSWGNMLHNVRATPEVADAASRRMLSDPPAGQTAQRTRHVAIARELVEAHYGSESGSEAEARAASADCEHCGGSGLAFVGFRSERRELVRRLEHTGEVIPPSERTIRVDNEGRTTLLPRPARTETIVVQVVRFLPLTCVCPMGKIREAAQRTRDIKKRTASLHEYLRNPDRVLSPSEEAVADQIPVF